MTSYYCQPGQGGAASNAPDTGADMDCTEPGREANWAVFKHSRAAKPTLHMALTLPWPSWPAKKAILPYPTAALPLHKVSDYVDVQVMWWSLDRKYFTPQLPVEGRGGHLLGQARGTAVRHRHRLRELFLRSREGDCSPCWGKNLWPWLLWVLLKWEVQGENPKPMCGGQVALQPDNMGTSHGIQVWLRLFGGGGNSWFILLLLSSPKCLGSVFRCLTNTLKFVTFAEELWDV